MENAETKILRRVFSDVCRGFTTALLDGKKVFIKHFSLHDQVDLDIMGDQFYKEAVRRGVNTEKQQFDFLCKENLWSQKDEDFILQKNTFIAKLQDDKKHAILQIQIEKQNEIIAKEKKLLWSKEHEKLKLFGLTAELYSAKKVNEHYIIDSFYYDELLHKKIFTEDRYDELDDAGIKNVILTYNAEIEKLNDANIKKLALQDFFQSQWSICHDDIAHFFGKPVCFMTIYQTRLVIYGRAFYNILTNNENLPEDIKKDPDKLLEYVSTGEKTKQVLSKNTEGKEGMAQSIPRAKKKDLQAAGVKDDEIVDMHKEVKKHGGHMSMHDFMKLQGIK